MILFMMAMAGCRGHATQPQGNRDTTAADSEVRTGEAPPTPFPIDSVKLSMSNEAGSVEVYIDYPTANDPASREVKAFIRSQLFGDKPCQVADDPSQLARQYCDMTLSSFAQALEQLNIKGVSKEEAPEEGMELRLIFTSSEYITYESWHYAYFTGGGHGTYGTRGITIRRADGKRMTHLADDSDALRLLIKKGLMEYFGVSNEKALAEYCTVPLDLLPMPAQPPYLVADGLRFQYDLYDICRFDDGAPSFTIPYDTLKNAQVKIHY